MKYVVNFFVTLCGALVAALIIYVFSDFNEKSEKQAASLETLILKVADIEELSKANNKILLDTIRAEDGTVTIEGDKFLYKHNDDKTE